MSILTKLPIYRTEKLPIIFIHGLAGTAHTYESIIPAFPDRTRISYDLEGHGKSPMTSEAPTIISLAQDDEDILQVCGFKEEKVDVVAHSAGTIIALQFSMMYPKHIGKLVLLGSAAQPMTGEVRNGMKGRAAVLRGSEKGLEVMVPFLLEVGLGEKAKANPYIVDMIEEEALAQDREGVARVIDAVAEFEWEEKDESNWKVYTIIVAGEEDKMADVQSGEALAKVTKARFLKMHVGHYFTYEDREGVIKLLNSVL